jgi:hypothetical protein
MGGASGAPFGVSKLVRFLNKSSKIIYKNVGGGPKKEAVHPGPKILLHGPAQCFYFLPLLGCLNQGG